MPDMFAPVQCCFMGQVYRDAVRIHNRGSAAMKATLSLPHAVQPFLQAQPIAGFCQVFVLELQACVWLLLPNTYDVHLNIVLEARLRCL